MNPLTYIKERWAARKRKRAAIRMLMASGIIRSANRTVRYAMTTKELERLMREETV